MELWIRSQDKLQLLKAEDLEVYDGGNKANNHFFLRCLGNYVGEYETKERVLEILNEIQDILCPKISKAIVGKNTEFIPALTYVYEMPQE